MLWDHAYNLDTTGALSARLEGGYAVAPRGEALPQRESAPKAFDILPLGFCRSIPARDVISRSTRLFTIWKRAYWA